MAKREKIRAKARRVALLFELGGRCKHCGVAEELEFDCIEPMGDTHHRYDTARRMTFYWRQYRLGNLQILCERCHNKKTAADLERNPF